MLADKRGIERSRNVTRWSTSYVLPGLGTSGAKAVFLAAADMNRHSNV